MKTFNKIAAQGDVLFQRIESLPDGLEVVSPVNGQVIVAHSETGHHHTMDGDTVTMSRLPGSIMDLFLDVKEPTELIHHRTTDTHETILFEPGLYHVRRQREYTPEGFRRVED